jgi:hypothetical protein
MRREGEAEGESEREKRRKEKRRHERDKPISEPISLAQRHLCRLILRERLEKLQVRDRERPDAIDPAEKNPGKMRFGKNAT